MTRRRRADTNRRWSSGSVLWEVGCRRCSGENENVEIVEIVANAR